MGRDCVPGHRQFYWDRVTNKAFSWSVLCAVVLFTIVRFELIPIEGVVAVFYGSDRIDWWWRGCRFDGIRIFRSRIAIAIGVIATAILLPNFIGFLREYIVLLGSLTAYGVSAVVCVAISLRSQERFDFSVLAERVQSFHYDRNPVPGKKQREVKGEPASARA